MRAKKLLKRLAVVFGCLAVVSYIAFWFLFFNPLEGTATQIRDMVPRNVDFYVHKARLIDDFDGDSSTFPYVPVLTEMGRDQQWHRLKQSKMWGDIEGQLEDLRQAFVESSVDVKIDSINFFDELLAREVQIAGRFGNLGFEDSSWVVYARVSAWAKMGYGWLLENGYSRDNVQASIEEDGDFYKITHQGKSYYVTRHLDVLMIANDRPMIVDSYELAQGNTMDVEPLGPSGHYIDGVRRPLQEWQKMTGVEEPNVLEFHLQPGNLIPKVPELRGWGKNIAEENRNEKILASFLNLDSLRFLSGTMIFENRSFTLLSHLVVNKNKHSRFQAELFSEALQPRSEWMDDFFGMVPQSAVAAAALRMPAGDFIRELFNDALDRDERLVINEQVKVTGKYKSFDDIITLIDSSVRNRVGILLRPNRRSEKTKQDFEVLNASPYPQFAWVFWIKRSRRTGRLMSKPLNDLINLLNTHRAAFNVRKAFRLTLAGGKSDAAFEFAIPQIPGTGNIAVCTYGEYFIFGNSGPMIDEMAKAVNGQIPSMRQDPDFMEIEPEVSSSVNGIGFVWARNLKKVVDDVLAHMKTLDDFMDPAWAMANRRVAEDWVLKNKFRQFGTKSQASRDPGWRDAVTERMNEMWASYQSKSKVANAGAVNDFMDIVQLFRTAYVEMVMKPASLQIRGRVLEAGYGR